MNVFLTVFLIVAALLVLISAIAAYYMYRYSTVRRGPVATVWESDEMFYRFRRLYEKCPSEQMEKRDKLRELGRAAERLTVKAHDGTILAARLIHPEGEAKCAFIMMHGYRSEPTHDFGPLAYDLLKQNVMLLIPDQRAHGGSEGRHITFGVKERYDTSLWAELLANRYPHMDIVLYGLSMGASTVMMASALPLPPSVRAVIADCGYTTPLEICEKVMVDDMHLPKSPLFPISRLAVRLLAGYDFGEASAVDAVRETKLPLLLIHGEEDGFVPFKMGEVIRDAAGEKCTFFAASGATHGAAYLCAPEQYFDTIRRFLNGADINF